jgi:hypothetical protein
MGRKIICDSCGAIYPFEKIKDIKVCPICNVPFDDDNSDHMESPNKNSGEDGWITWYYYGQKDKKGRKTTTTSLRDKPINLEEFGDIFFLIKEFKAPPESECGLDKVKEILRTYIPDAFVYPEKKEPVVRCPRCMSREYTLMNKGFSIFTGFLGSGRVKRVCNYCKKEF